MNIFTGRFDQYAEEEIMIDYFTDLIAEFEAEDCLMVFEDETKTGLPCKPHYHFIFKTDSTHDKIRRWISKNDELKGTNSSLKSIDVSNEHLAMIYLLKQYKKQQYIPFSDYDQEALSEYIIKSQDYNYNLKLNNWPDHLAEITRIIIEDGYTMNTPFDINMFIIKYIIKWNSDEEHQRIEIPNNKQQATNYVASRVFGETQLIEYYCKSY